MTYKRVISLNTYFIKVHFLCENSHTIWVLNKDESVENFLKFYLQIDF